MNETGQEETPSPFVAMSGRELGLVGAVGAGAGLITWLVYWLIVSYGGPALFCHNYLPNLCYSIPSIEESAGLIVGAIAGLLGLVRLRVFRSLLVVLATTITFVGIEHQLSELTWYWAALASIILFALSYAIYAWLSRIRMFLLELVLVVILMVVTRLVLFG